METMSNVRGVGAIAVSACLAAGGTIATCEARAPAAGALEEVVVTGTLIHRRSQLDSPSPLVTIGREDLADAGTNEFAEVIEDLTINTGSENHADAFTQNFSTGTSNVNLRGLGVGSTLVLIDGGRETQSAVATDRGENFVDTSSLPPMIAFDRIEILKDGATSLYGSDAVAGVVNFITRDRFEGFELELGVQALDRRAQNDTTLSLLWGGGSDDTRVLAAFSHLDREPLTTKDRRLSSKADDLSQAGNPGSFILPTVPGNPAYAPVWTAAFDSNGNGIADAVEPGIGLPPVAGAELPVFADPDCSKIAAEDDNVVPSIRASVPTAAGDVSMGLCQFDFGDFYSIVPEEKRSSALFALRHDFGDRLGARVQVHVADNEAERDNSPSFPFSRLPVVPASHPDNPFGTDVSFIGRAVGAGGVSVPSLHESVTMRLAAGIDGDVNDHWRYDVGVTLSENEFSVATTDTLIDRFGLAIAGFGGPRCDPSTGTAGAGECVYFNPFGSALTGTGTTNSESIIDDIAGEFRYDAKSGLTTVEAYLSGDLAELAGGAAAIAAGVELRADRIAYDYDANTNGDNFQFFSGIPDFGGHREAEAVFVELALPLPAAVDLQLAARYENYGGGVDSADPKVTLLWRPAAEFSLRASLGTSFRVPSLFQEFGVQTTLSQLVDPNVGIPQFFPVRAEAEPGAPGLQPEEAEVFNLGFSRSIGERFELGVDYWSFDYARVIVGQSPQALLDAAAAGDPEARLQTVRDPASGLLLRVDSYFVNASALKTDGFDISSSYERATAAGATFEAGVDATLITSYDLVDPQAGRVDGLGRRNFRNFGTSTPALRATGFFGLERENRRASVFLRYIDGYRDDEGAGASTKIESQLTVDAQYAVRLRGESGPMLTIGAMNLFDRNAPHVATNGGYDSKVHDPRGRLWYARAVFRL